MLMRFQHSAIEAIGKATRASVAWAACTTCVACIGLVVTGNATRALAQTTAFTYQGQLDDGGAPADGLHDFRFRLFDAAGGGAQIGPVLCADNVGVSQGLLTV